jgi:diaminopimelate decarboxylase
MTAVEARRELLRELAERFGTPLYVYQLDAVRESAGALASLLPPGMRRYYALKANPHPLLAATLRELGLHAEMSSTGELASAVAAGFAMHESLYTGPAKTVEEMVAAARAGVRRFALESEADHRRLLAAAERAQTPLEYLVRLHPASGPAAAGLRMTGAPSQFGVDLALLHGGSPMLRPSAAATPVGFHLFSATNLAVPEALLAELSANASWTAQAARRCGFEPRLVDLGGGFAAPFATPGARSQYPQLRAALAARLDEELPGWRGGEPVVAVESGRFLVAEAGVLVTTVMDVKPSGDRRYVLCDAGVNVLGGMSGIGRLLPAAQPDGQPDPGDTAVLAGPLCTPLDVLSRQARIGNLVEGDLLTIPNVGAYGLTASLVAFLGRPMPVEVVLDGETVVGSRRLTVTATEVN